jgi:Arc/MetJ family transcription regulator
MRTTIAIDEELMDELMRAEQGVSRSEAVRRAIKDYVWKKRCDDFMTLAGSRLVDVDWREAERQELEEVRRREGRKPHGRARRRPR